MAIADYRLAPVGQTGGARYPEASVDVGDALKFIIANEEVKKVADIDRVFLLGHSVGGMIQSTLMFHPMILSTDLRSRIKGGIFNGAMHDMPLDPAPIPFNTYYDLPLDEKDTSYTLV